MYLDWGRGEPLWHFISFISALGWNCKDDQKFAHGTENLGQT